MEENKLGTMGDFESQKAQCLQIADKNIADMKRIFNKYYNDFNVNSIITKLEYAAIRIRNCSTSGKLMLGWNEFSYISSVYRILLSYEHSDTKGAISTCNAELCGYDKDSVDGKVAICQIIDALSNSTIIPELSETILKFLSDIDEPYAKELNNSVSVSTKIVLADRAKAPRRG